jgi:hypothetical protein
MRLTKAKIQRYRSVADSGWFDVENRKIILAKIRGNTLKTTSPGKRWDLAVHGGILLMYMVRTITILWYSRISTAPSVEQ